MVPIVPVMNNRNSASDIADALDMARAHSVEEIRAMREKILRKDQKAKFKIFISSLISFAVFLVLAYFGAPLWSLAVASVLIIVLMFISASLVLMGYHASDVYDLAISIKLYEEAKKEPDKSQQ